MQIFIYTLLCVSINNTSYAKMLLQSFDNIKTSYVEKQYGRVLYSSLEILQETLKKLVQDTIRHIPSKHRIISTSHDYSVNLHNDMIQFSICVEYQFRYNQYTVQNTLLYVSEESNYYKTYIEAKEFANSLENIEVFTLKKSVLGSYLWNDNEKTAYYIYKFPAQKKYDRIDFVSGLLLKIMIPKASTVPHDILEEIIQEIDWSVMSNLYENNR